MIVCPAAQTADNRVDQAVSKIEQGLKTAVQTQAPTIAELNQEPVLDAPLLINMYFDDYLDSSKKWDWTNYDTYLQTLDLARNTNPEFKAMYDQYLQSASDMSKSATLSDAAINDFVQKMTSATLSNVPSHCQQKTSLDKVEQMLVDLCVSNPNFDLQTTKDAINTFYDNLGKPTLQPRLHSALSDLLAESNADSAFVSQLRYARLD